MPPAKVANVAVAADPEMVGDMLRYKVTWDALDPQPTGYLLNREGESFPYNSHGALTAIAGSATQAHDYLLHERPTKYQVVGFDATGMGTWSDAATATPKGSLERKGLQLLIRRFGQWTPLTSLLGSAQKISAGYPDIRRDLDSHGGEASGPPWMTIARVRGGTRDGDLAFRKIDAVYTSGGGKTVNVYNERAEACYEIRGAVREPDLLDDVASAVSEAVTNIEPALLRDGVRSVRWLDRNGMMVIQDIEGSPHLHLFRWVLCLTFTRIHEREAMGPLDELLAGADALEGIVMDTKFQDGPDADSVPITLK